MASVGTVHSGNNVNVRSDQSVDTPQRFSLPPKPSVTADSSLRFKISGLKVFYGPKEVLHGIDINISSHVVTALIGPSGCGKSTFLRSLNRMTETEIGRAHV